MIHVSVRARCTACGRAVLLDQKGRFPRHQMKGGAFCAVVGTQAPRASAVSKKSQPDQARVPRNPRRLRGLRVIRLGRGPMGSEIVPIPSTSGNRKGLWRPGSPLFERRSTEE